MKKHEPLNLDAGDNQHWTKQSWDLPPYKSEEFYNWVGENELDHFRTLPVFRLAVKKGLIKNDEWVGKTMKPERLPNGNLLIPKRAEGPNGIIGDGMIEITSDDPEYKEWDGYLTKIEAEEKMKYFVHFLDDGRAGVAIRLDNVMHCYRFDWARKTWVYDPAIFLKMHGVGGDGYDWEEVTKEQAEEHIKSRSG